MNLRTLLLSFVLLSLSSNVFANQFVLLDKQKIQTVKSQLADGSASQEAKDVYKRLLKDANKLLASPNYSVINKTIIPPGATANDFVSISSKAWPDENKPGGLPWVKLADTNPDSKSDKVDRQRINDMANTVFTLSQAYYFSDDVKYAAKASSMIKTWFLATRTRMSPHLQYAQTIPGIDKKNSSGVMDGRLIPNNILDSINLIRGSAHWSERFDQVMNQWLTQYLTWLTGSKMGHNAAKKTDRNGSWYYLQTTSLAWYLNDTKALSRNIKFAKGNLKKQFNSKGGLIKELGRSKSYSDSCFSLEGLTGIAIIANKAGKKFWDLPSKNKSSIAKGINYLIPASIDGNWTDSEEDIDVTDCIVAFSRYAEYTGSSDVSTTVNTLQAEISDKAKKGSDDRRALRYLTLLNPQG